MAFVIIAIPMLKYGKNQSKKIILVERTHLFDIHKCVRTYKLNRKQAHE